MSQQDTPQDRSFVARYGATILRGGIAAIPTALFRYQAELKLKPQHCWFISAILSHKWDSSMPYPSLKRMADQSGVSRRQLHNYQNQLVDAGYLIVVNRRTHTGAKDSNYYDFTPLFTQLEQLLDRDCSKAPATPSSSHTHVNPSSHTHENPPSHTDVNPSSHKKKQLEESIEQESEPIEHSNLRRALNEETQSSQAPNEPEPNGNGEPERVGDILARAAYAESRSRPRPETMDEDYQRIQDCIIDRRREFNDTASVKSSTTRAWRLFQRSGTTVERFIDHIYQARAITQERTAAITKTAEDPEYHTTRKTKMAYFFAVLEDHLGLSDRPESSRKGRRPAAGAP